VGGWRASNPTPLSSLQAPPTARHPTPPFTPPLTAAWAGGLPIPSAGLPPPRSPPPTPRAPAAAAFLRATLRDAVSPVPPLDTVPPAARAAAVRSAAAWAWAGYVAHAWGADELAPVSRSGYETFCSLGVTPIDALDTLHLMGFPREFARAADFVVASLPARLAANCTVSVFETAIRVVGGLAAAADASGDARLGSLAVDAARRLLPAFDTPSGVPRSDVDLAAGPAADVFREASAGTALLAEAVLVPEFVAAARWEARLAVDAGASPTTASAPNILASPLAAASLRSLDAVLANAPEGDSGLLPTTLSVDTGAAEWRERHTVGGRADSAYEYLLKTWLMLRGASDAGVRARGERYRRAWVRAMDVVLDRLVVSTPSGAATYATSDLHEPVAEHLACFLPGNLFAGVSAGAVRGTRAARYRASAAALLTTCVAMGESTATGLPPEVALFLPELRPGHPFSLLRPETAESLFLAHAATGDPAWREAGWRLFVAIETAARVATGGYSGVRDVTVSPPALDDSMPSWLLAESFCYLFLLFDDDAAAKVAGKVLSTEAHPLAQLL